MLGHHYKEKLILTNKANFKDGETCNLSLLISNNTFIYSISGYNYVNIYELGHVEILNLAGTGNLAEKVAVLLNNYQLLQRKFGKVSISILNKEFTIVPEAYSSSTDLKDFLAFSSGNSEIPKPLFHLVKNVKFCYFFDQELFQFLEKTFANALIKHAGALDLELFFSNHSLLNCNLFLNINDGLIELSAKDKNDLLFYNVFSYENNEDVLYYLLFLMEQFNLNPLSTKLLIGGQIPTNDPLVLSIKKYIKQVNFVVHDIGIKLEGELSKLPQHYYFNLLNQHLCE